MPDNEKKIESLMRNGSEIVGHAVGGAVGFLLGGPGGAAIGGASGVIIKKTLDELANRFLSKREVVRVGAAAVFSIEKIKAYLDSGQQLREDGFFDNGGDKRPNAEEIFEGVLLKSKNEHEEKKIRILANIFANIAFQEGFSVGEANHLLQIAGSLTYRKMCILSLLERKNQFKDIKLRDENYREYKEPIFYETISILQEVFEMEDFGLLGCKSKPSQNYDAMLGFTDVAPNKLILTELGKRYCAIMGLDDISEEDVKEVAKYLI